ncbi:MAG: UDP-N-acetylmuramyl-tripeptide synthetase [Patescibacteria group bacterium]|nr:UDP-N-acetylmuramyl-tripeptide synthetase [Patescibacteria group bacterium]
MEILLHKIKKYIPKKIFKFLQPAYHFLLSAIAAFWYHFPSDKLIVIGITGTTGKTTSLFLMAKTLVNAGYKVGYISTAMFSDGQTEWLNDKKMTMPGRFFSQKILAQMVKNKCHYVIIETTSEGIEQFRHRFINYDILIFTCLYPEHIESHGSFENYKQAKGKLFAHLKKCHTKYVDEQKIIKQPDSGIKKIGLNRIKKTIIANADDKYANYFFDFWAEEKIGYTNKVKSQKLKVKSNLNVIIEYGNINVSEVAINFFVEETNIVLKLLGEFNVVNAMNAVCLGVSQGISLAKVANGLSKVGQMTGRLEIIKEKQPFTVIVDYAFEPVAITKLYEAVKVLSHHKIIHLLGSCGGGRDKSRRSELGKIAGVKADIVIITNEDPYDEDPQIIIEQVAISAKNVGKIIDKNLFKILDRREAIKKALSLAKDGDLVLITGKGCEQKMCVADGVKIPWDDRKVVREELLGIGILY